MQAVEALKQLLEEFSQMKESPGLKSDIALDLLFLAIPILDSPELVLADATPRLLHAHFQVSLLSYLSSSIHPRPLNGGSLYVDESMTFANMTVSSSLS